VLKEFIDARTRMWRRLEELIDEVRLNRLSRLSRDEVRELARLYRRTAADLAIARQEVRDPLLVNYLNGLVGRAHGAIYRNESSGFRVFLDFFRYEFPAVFRRTFGYTATAFLLTVVFAAAGAFATSADERFADAVVPGIREKVIAHEDWTQKINDANPVHSALIQQNNIMVCAMAFGGGMLAGLGTLYILMVNGLMLGVIVTLCLRYNFQEILIFISGHGVLELSAIFISGGAGLMLASALIAPGDRTRVDALIAKGRQAVVLMLGCAVMLMVAGTIEGFLSPAHIHYGWKLAVSATSGLLMTLYFLKPDRRAPSATSEFETKL
jgi:uncharacterized membrane protein SpoIIM required for sporulation